VIFYGTAAREDYDLFLHVLFDEREEYEEPSVGWADNIPLRESSDSA
jgi:hypothetical protein